MMEYIKSSCASIAVGSRIFTVKNQSDDRCSATVVKRHVFIQSNVKSVVLNKRLSVSICCLLA